MEREAQNLEKLVLDVLSAKGGDPISFSRMYVYLDKPRPPRWAIQQTVNTLQEGKYIEAIRIGKFSYYRKVNQALVIHKEHGYSNPTVTSSSFNLAAQRTDPFFLALSPLRYGKSILLWMVSKEPISKGKDGGSKKRLVCIVPGGNIGLGKECVLVAIVGAGSCIVRPEDGSISGLILAKMPAGLAKELVSTLNDVFYPTQENTNGGFQKNQRAA